MDMLEQNIRNLISSIQESEIYREYKKEEERLLKDPYLMERVDLFRQNSFHLQGQISGENIFDTMDRLNWESSDLRKMQEVSAYLDAELALCKMIRRICLDITEGIEIRIPEI
mgnify:CR=1 FL=1